MGVGGGLTPGPPLAPSQLSLKVQATISADVQLLHSDRPRESLGSLERCL